MSKPSAYLSVVEKVYRDRPRARDNDAILIASVFTEIFHGEFLWRNITLKDYLIMVFRGTVPSMDTITRAGRAVRQHHPELRGTKTAEERREAEKQTVLEDLGYRPTDPDPNQIPLL